MKNSSNSYRFVLLDPHDAQRAQKNIVPGDQIFLYPFKNISLHSFSFPFSGLSKVRDALRIQYKPLLGEGSEAISFIPFFVNMGKRSSSGCVFMLFGAETASIEENLSANKNTFMLWPTAFAFAGEIEGSGVILLQDRNTISTLWVQDWVPMFYKTADNADTTLEDEENLVLAYISEQGKTTDRILRLSGEDLSEDQIQSYGSQTLAGCPAYEQLDLSNKGTNLLEKREQMTRMLTRSGKVSIAAGILVFLLAGGLYLQRAPLANEESQNLETIYRSSFGETSRQPVSSALTKIRTLEKPEMDASLQSTLRVVSSIWDKMSASGDIFLEVVKYSSDNTDILGTAENNDSIQHLRSLLEAEGYSSKADNIQKIPSGELRFNMTISRGKQS